MLAETDDDLSTLSLPAKEPAPAPSPQEDLKSGIDASKSPESKLESPSSKAEDSPSLKPSKPSTAPTSAGKPRKQRYPLYPSVAHLFHENGLSSSEAEKVPASGPKGRLLKGDVLGYLGKISSSYSYQQSTRIARLGHLDFNNVKPAPPIAMGPSQRSEAQAQKAPEPEPELTDTEVAIPISLSSVISVQQRIQATLGVTLPLSTFIARATDLANEDLPRSEVNRPSADGLFNDILGPSKVGLKAPRGRYLPQITALPATPFMERAGPRRQTDVYGLLTGESPTTASIKGKKAPPLDSIGDTKARDSTNVFSVSAAKGDERRARVFLERVKTILQVEPGKLIL